MNPPDPNAPKKQPRHPPRPRGEPFDAHALHERTMRRFPITMARLAELEREDER